MITATLHCAKYFINHLEKFTKNIEKRADKYGPVYCFQVIDQFIVVNSDPDAVKVYIIVIKCKVKTTFKLLFFIKIILILYFI